jgi:hypothetical protein
MRDKRKCKLKVMLNSKWILILKALQLLTLKLTLWRSITITVLDVDGALA